MISWFGSQYRFVPSLSIRRFRSADAHRVRELHRDAIRGAGTDPAKLPDTSDLEAIREHYVESGGEFLVGEYGGEIVAMGGIRPTGDGVAEIKRMRVDPDHQGQGFGRTILEGLAKAAKERGFDRLVAETAERQDSAGFYRAHGFEEVNRRQWNEFELIRLEKDLR